MSNIPEVFLTQASEILANTNNGLSGSKIVKYFSDFAVEFNIDIPYSNYPFPKGTPNKRTAFKKNLKKFKPDQQFKVIAYLCDLEIFQDNEEAKKLKIRLFERYNKLNIEKVEMNIDIQEIQHWLESYPNSLKPYQEAIRQLELSIFQRNLLDNLRLSLELLLKKVLGNEKSLENQQKELGNFIIDNNLSKELNNMFLKLIDYYSKYHNQYVKHNDKVNNNEIEIIFDLTSLFMKFLIKLKKNS